MRADRISLEARTKGWLHPGEGECLYRWGLKSPGPLLELGSYCGKSTLWVGSAAEEIGQPLVSLDWHRGNPEMRPGNDCFDPDVWDPEVDATDTVPHLRRTLHAAGLERVVSMVCASSAQAATWWTTPLGFVFIDADHGTAAIDDYYRWSPHLMDDGVLAFHDADGPIASIMRACDDARRDGWVERENVYSLRVFTR